MRNVDPSQNRGCKEGEAHGRHGEEIGLREVKRWAILGPAQAAAVSGFISSSLDPRGGADSPSLTVIRWRHCPLLTIM